MILFLCLLAVFASFLHPMLYAGCVLSLCCFLFSYRTMRTAPPMPHGTASAISLFLLFAAFAMIGPTLNIGGGKQNIDSMKFLFAAASLVIGLMLGVEKDELPRWLPIFFVVIALYYTRIFLVDAKLSQDLWIYPPDYNNSAAMLATFLPLVVLGLKARKRAFSLATLMAFSLLVASRSLLALVLVATTFSLERIRRQHLLKGLTLAIASAAILYGSFSLDNFSDLARLRIVDQSLQFALSQGANAFNFGELAFANYLNLHLGFRSLEVQHAHNFILQIWCAYGLVPLFGFLAFLIAFSANAWSQRNYLCLASIATFLIVGIIEALTTDIRAFGTIMFILGYTYSRGSKVELVRNSPHFQRASARLWSD